MNVPLLDATRQYQELKSELDAAVLEVLSHGRYILGPEVQQFEQELAAYCRIPHAIGVASGTDALLLALRAVGVQPGDEVITTDFSFFATAGVIDRLGATPVFVDIDPESYNLDPGLIPPVITNKTKAVVPVHLYGQVADMDPILDLAREHGLAVVEDAAQAIGAEYKGRAAGSMGDYGCFSFYPTKNLGAAGDGGAIVTGSKERDALCRILRVHGAKPKYYHQRVGYNSRLATIQAAVLRVKLPHLRAWSEKRIENARRYDVAFAPLTSVKRPVVGEHSTFHIFNQYTIAVPNREELTAGLRDAGIGFEIYYPVPFHRQECFASLGYGRDAFPQANKASGTVLSLPIYSEMREEEQQHVIEIVTRLVG